MEILQSVLRTMRNVLENPSPTRLIYILCRFLGRLHPLVNCMDFFIVTNHINKTSDFIQHISNMPRGERKNSKRVERKEGKRRRRRQPAVYELKNNVVMVENPRYTERREILLPRMEREAKRSRIQRESESKIWPSDQPHQPPIFGPQQTPGGFIVPIQEGGIIHGIIDSHSSSTRRRSTGRSGRRHRRGR